MRTSSQTPQAAEGALELLYQFYFSNANFFYFQKDYLPEKILPMAENPYNYLRKKDLKINP